jgi:hypothetical protein
MLECHFCGAKVTQSEPIGREATCEECGRDLRCCMQCRHYDPSYNNSCTEPMADPVTEKDRRNFCEYFYFSRTSFRVTGAGADTQAKARAKLEGLFKDPPGTPPRGGPVKDRASDARSKLDALFKPKPPDD